MKLLNILIGLLFIASVCPASAQFDIVRPDKESWTCVDYSVDFARNNPEWGVVTLSSHPHFKGLSHMVNYKIIDDETILIHDEMYGCEYYQHNWIDDKSTYYHFWLNDEQIKRTYVILRDNRGMVI